MLRQNPEVLQTTAPQLQARTVTVEATQRKRCVGLPSILALHALQWLETEL